MLLRACFKKIPHLDHRMIRLLCRNFHHLCDPKQRFNPTLLRSLYSSVPKSQQEPANPNASLTVSFLVDSCGLSLSSALSAAKKVHLKSPNKPNAVLSLFKDHGFTDTHIATLVAKLPKILLFNPEKIIKPKLEFFLGVGYSAPDLARLISLDPLILACSLNKVINHNFTLLSSLLGSHEAAATMIIKVPRLIYCKVESLVLPKVKILRDHRVPLLGIVQLATKYPRVLGVSCDVFKTKVELIKGMSLDPSPMMFARAVFVMCQLSPSKWEEKLAVYRSVGWSEKETLSAFARHPSCMALSEEKIRRAMDFFVKKLHLKPSYLAMRPRFLSLSLEKRIIPRCAVENVLLSEGVIRKKLSLKVIMEISERDFFERFVLKHQDQVPQVFEAYKGKMNLFGLE